MLTKATIGVAFTVSLFMAACGSAGSDAAAEETRAEVVEAAAPVAEAAAAEAAGNVVEVHMMDDGTTFKFEPSVIEVQKGAVVRFVHHGTQPHNVEFVKDGVPAGVDLGANWSGTYVISAGGTYEVTIDDRFVPGTYDFICTPHVGMNMKGQLVVKG